MWRLSPEGHNSPRPAHRWLALPALLLLLACPPCPGWGAPAEGTARGKAPQLLAAIPQDYPPLYTTDEDGQPSGFAVEVIEAVARRAGFSVAYTVERTWSETLEALRQGRVDIVPSLGMTPGRDNEFSFSQPVEVMPNVIFVRVGDREPGGLDALAGRRLGVVGGTSGLEMLEGQPNLHVKTMPDFAVALIELLSGGVDALVCPEPVLLRLARRAGVDERVRVVGRPLGEVKRAIALRPGRLELLARLDQAVGQLLASSEYQEIYSRWYGRPRPFWSAGRVASILGGLLVLTLLGAVVGRMRSISQVNRRLAALVSQREQTQAELAESQARFRQLADNIDAVFWLTSLDMAEMCYVNQAYEHIWGRPALRVYQNPWCFMEAIHPDDRPRVESRKRQHMAGQGYGAIEYRLLQKGGQVRWVRDRSFPVYDSRGDIFRVAGIALDITEGKQAEAELHRARVELEVRVAQRTRELNEANQALRNSEEKYRQVVEQANEAIVVVQDGVFRYGNPRALAMTGYAREEFEGLPAPRVAHSDEPPAAQRAQERRLGKVASEHYQTRIALKDGSSLWVEVSDVAILWEGRPASLHLINDISARRRAEEESLAYQAQLRLLVSELTLTEERERRVLASDLHDGLGQDLALMRIKLKSLLETGQRPAKRAVAELLPMVDRAFQKARSLTMELSPPILSDLGLGPALDWLARQTQEQHGITVEFHGRGEEPELAVDAKVLLFRVARELVMNAVKHAGAGRIEITLEQDRRETRLVVRDNGAGLDPAHLESYLDRGFGLFSIRERVSYLSGQVGFEAHPGQGTQVILRVPLCRS